MPDNEPAIANYDDQTAEEIRQRLRKLSQDDLRKLEAYEKQGQARSTVLEAIAALRADVPWSGYDDMEVEEVNDALKQRDGDAAGRVLDYERHHKARTTVMEFARRRREESDGSSGSAPPSAARQRKSASRSTGSNSRKSGSNSGRSKTTSRPAATRARTKTAGRSRSSHSSAPAIANYDEHTADEIMQRLRRLSQSELAELEAYEKQGEGRRTVLETIAALRGDEPWSGYDNMEVAEVNKALKRRDGETAGRVLDYERRHKGRKTIIEFAKARAGAERESQARTRSRSTRDRKTTQRPSAARSSGSRQTGRSRGGSQRRSQSGGASRSRTESRKPAATRSTQSESRAKEALQAAAAKLRQRATETLRSAEGPTKKLAKDTGQVVGSAAQAAPARLRDRATEALRTAEGPTKKLARDTEQAVGSAANKAKGPALVGAATLAAVGGGIALGSKVKRRRRRRVLGVAVPRRTAVGNAAKRVGIALDSLSSTGQEIGQWSDDVQYLRQRIAGGNGPPDKTTAVASRKVTPRAVARRIVC